MRPRFSLSLMTAFVAAVMISSADAQPPQDGQREGRGGFGSDRGDFGGERGGPRGGRGGFGGGERGGQGGFGGRGRGGPDPRMMMRMIPVLNALDANDDGKISKSEIENAAVALKKLDKNNDGDLTEEEMRPERGPGGPRGGFGPPRGEEFGGGPPGEGPGGPGGFGGRRAGGDAATGILDRLMANDKNKDGKLTKDEIPSERMKAMIDRADKDGDGAASKDEILAMAKARMGGGGRGGFGGRGGAGGRGGSEGDSPSGGQRPRRPPIEE